MIVQRLEDLPDLSSAKVLVLDTETSGFVPEHGARICGIVIGPYDSEDGWYLPLRHRDGNLPIPETLAWLKKLTDDPAKTWIFHNAKYDLKMLESDGLPIRGGVRDTMIAACTFDGDIFSYSLDALTKKFVPGFVHTKYEEVEKYLDLTQPKVKTWLGEAGRNYSLVPLDLLGEYALEDLQATRLLAKALSKQTMYAAPENFGCPSWGTKELLNNEMQLISVLKRAEQTGTLIDVPRLCELKEKSDGEIDYHQQKMFDLCGFSFAPAAWTVMTKAFEKAGGRVRFWNKQPEARGKQKLDQFTEVVEESTGRPNWNSAAVLKYLQGFNEDENQNAYDFVFHYRESMLRERVSTMFLDGIMRRVDKYHVLRGQFHQHRVVTGRLSSTEPNLQNLSKPGGNADQKAMEKFLGLKQEDALNKMIRSLFIARPGHLLISIDWSQIEYRAAVWVSQDEHMIQRWNEDPAMDFHQATLDLLDGAIDRDAAKIVNFGTLYGMSAKGLASSLSGMGRPTTRDDAKVILDLLFSARPALRNLIKDVSQRASRDGCIQNPMGRICKIDVGFEYKALNYLVQGFVGDMMREALVRIQRVIDALNLPVRILMTVHDEVVFEIPEQFVDETVPVLRKEMMTCPWMGIPVLCDVEVGRRWSDQVPYECWFGRHDVEAGKCKKCKKSA